MPTTQLISDGDRKLGFVRNCQHCLHRSLRVYAYPCTECQYPYGSMFTQAEEDTKESEVTTTTMMEGHENIAEHIDAISKGIDVDMGTAATSPHYNKLPIQPIEVMFDTVTRAEFIGHLKCTIIKYAMRAGLKGEMGKDVNKYYQYLEWLNALRSNPELTMRDLLKKSS